MVFLDQKELVIEYQSFDLSEIMSRHPAISSKTNGIKLKLALATCRTNMNMSRFFRLIRIEMEPKRTDPQHCRHGNTVPPENG